MKKKEKQIGIIDYGVGNIFNIEKACRLYSENVILARTAEDMKNCHAIILPGVGAFAYGMECLRKRGLVKPIQDFARSGRTVLGICLGAQLLFSKSFEMGETEGLNLISGQVVAFPPLKLGYKVPNIGWRALKFKKSAKSSWSNLDGKFMYFVHSYVIIPDAKDCIVATASYGGCKFCAICSKGNIYGNQFHPEKSGKNGLVFIKDFIHNIKTDEPNRKIRSAGHS